MNNIYTNNANNSKALLNLSAVILCAYVLNSLLSTDNDTVNYILWHKRRIVYHGICYVDRMDARLNEHELRGLIFDEYDYDHAKPRNRAQAVEQIRIKRDKPKYNVHHNY
jgi:hypothetical protein